MEGGLRLRVGVPKEYALAVEWMEVAHEYVSRNRVQVCTVLSTLICSG